MDDDKGGQRDALSPSMITDYFRSSKPKHHQKKGKSALKKDSPACSVYLTPESSPGSNCTSENPAKEIGGHDDKPLAVGLETDVHVISRAAGEGEGDLNCTAGGCTLLKVESENAETDTKDVDRRQDSPSSETKTKKSAASCSGSPRSPKKCSRQEEKDAHAPSHRESENANPSQNCSSPVLYSVRSCAADTSSSSSPCLPRLKLRKSATSKSQSAPVAAGKEWEVLKPKPGRRKKKEPEAANNSVITDFFPVRRSGRQTKSEIEKEKQHQLEQMILSGCEEGLEVKEFESKGRGVVATKNFERGDFVVEYAGDLIDLATAREREEKYANHPDIGCYMYYFKCGSQQFCVDATAESGKLGRLLNHSSKGGNCCTRSLEVEGIARLILVAKRDISCGEELTYDYGDRSKASIASHPWLKL